MQKLSIETVRANIVTLRDSGKKWREIAEQYPTVKIGTLCRIAHDETYDPKDNTIRHALGLQQHYIEVAPLPCGHAPGGKRCAVCQPKPRQPDPVIRVKRLKERIAALPYADDVKREIERALIGA